MNELVQALINKSDRPSPIRMGRIEHVTDSAGGLASVRMGDVVIEDLTWLRRYTPVVGDRVAVLASGSGWLVLGRCEPVQSIWGDQQEMVLPNEARAPDNTLVAYRELLGNRQYQLTNSWDDDIRTPTYDPKLPEPMPGEPWTLYLQGPDVGHMAWAGQGDLWQPGETPIGYLNYRPRQAWSQIVIRTSYYRIHPAMGGKSGMEVILPEDSRIESLALRIRMNAQQHSPGIQHFRIWGMPPGVVTKYPGLPPMEVQAEPGDAFDLPIDGDWLLALQTGLIDGFIIDPGRVPTVHFCDEGGILYPEPGQSATYTTDDLLKIVVKYVTPANEA